VGKPNNMRIGYVLDRFPSINQTFVLREMLELERLGFDLIVFSLKRPPTFTHRETQQLHAPVIYCPDGQDFGKYARALSLTFLESPAHTLRSAAQVFGAHRRAALSNWARAQVLQSMIRAAGVSHLHAHFASGANVVAMFAGAALQIPFSFTVHAVDLFSRPLMLAESLRRASFTVTISHYNRTYIANQYGAEAAQRLHVVRAGIDTTEFSTLPRAASAPPRILAVGRLVEKKGYRYLIEALAVLQKAGYLFECMIVGDGPDRDRLSELIHQLGLTGAVHLLGAKTQDDIKELYSTSTAFALPCVQAQDGDLDGIPVSLMEAMAARLPVVSTSVSGIPELVTHKQEGLLVAPKDVDGLASALAQLLEDASLREQLGAAGCRKVQREFDVRQSATLLGELFFDAQGMRGTS
jgi:glycosyltransferase involved in cell wall biosynthesis